MTIWDIVILVTLALIALLVITFVIISLTTGFVKTGRLSGGLYCITAPPSNGKSYVATHIAVEFLKAGRRVFTNYPIVYNNGREILQSRALTKDMLLKYNFNGSVIIIDEAHNWFWSRKFKEFTEEYKNWFSTLSQHEISLYYIVQHEDRVDTVINDCANLFGEIKKTEIPILEMPIFFTVTWWNKEIDMQFGRTSDKVQPFHEERIWFDKDVAQSYDTKWFGHDKRPIYEGITWIEWLKIKHGFDYQGNYSFSLKSQIINMFLKKIYNPVKLKITDVVKMVRKYWSEMGKTFDRDEDERKYDETVIEANGGAPSGVRRPSLKDLPALSDEQLEQIDDLLEGEKDE